MLKKTRTSKLKLFTIGYHGRDIDMYVEELLAHKIKLLCDVRKNPISRIKSFSKNKLRQAVEAVGIKYLHFPQLGVPTEKRHAAKDRLKMFARYKRTTIPREREAIQEMADLFKDNPRIAFTCVESDAHDCHRSLVADAVHAAAKLKEPVEHI